jgi:hypothetical protein
MALSVVALLGGCASSTRIVKNDKVSETVKAKSANTYKEVLLLPPRNDPRNVVPKVVSGIEAMGLKVRLMDPTKPIEPAQGTGFVVGRDGWVLTCAHVLGENKEATVTLNGERLLADVVKSDDKADLALLKLRTPLPGGAAVLGLRVTKPAAMGEDVYTIGYPLSRLLGNNARMTRGLLSATSGLHDDESQLQVSAEIQPGNSGGPLLDRDGNVIGIVNKTLSPAAVAQATGGALPQNVNFAIKGGVVAKFVEQADDGAFRQLAYDRSPGLESPSKAVAKIQAGIVPTDAEQRSDKLVVRLTYHSRWDIWYRFQYFVLAAFDHETQEPLFAAGQGRDNMISTEEIVIRDTLEQFKKALQSR